MSNINVVALSGNLTRDPELRETKNGTSVCNAAIAVNRSRKVEDEYVDEVSFFDLTIWGKYGELFARKLKKGDSVFVSGRLEQSRWETEDGEKRSKVVVIIDQANSDGFFRSKEEDSVTTASDDTPAAPAAEAEAPAKATQVGPNDEFPWE